MTPKRCELSAQAAEYAAEIVAKRLGVWEAPPPSYWMERGVELEDDAVADYERRNNVCVERAGFILPDDTDCFGGSPDGIVVGQQQHVGLLEVKCPKPERLILCHARQNSEPGFAYPAQWLTQIQGLLLISGLPWCDVWVWHPEIAPYCERVEADVEYQAKLLEAIESFLTELERVSAAVSELSAQQSAYCTMDEGLDD